MFRRTPSATIASAINSRLCISTDGKLAVYFGFYVLPFHHDLFTDEEFLAGFPAQVRPASVRSTGMLPEVPQRFPPWKKSNVPANSRRNCTILRNDAIAEFRLLFYQVGLTREEADRSARTASSTA